MRNPNPISATEVPHPGQERPLRREINARIVDRRGPVGRRRPFGDRLDRFDVGMLHVSIAATAMLLVSVLLCAI